jgi:hypothetical protein
VSLEEMFKDYKEGVTESIAVAKTPENKDIEINPKSMDDYVMARMEKDPSYVKRLYGKVAASKAREKLNKF